MSSLLLAALAALSLTTTAAVDEPVVTVDQELSTEAVLALVDTRYPGLEALAEALAAGDDEAAKIALARHFATRDKPVVPEPRFPGVGESNSMVVARADAGRKQVADEQWLKHVFTLANNDEGTQETFDLGPEIDWLHNPSEALSWSIYLNQLNVVAHLAGLYAATSEEKYAQEAGDLVQSWVRRCPRGLGGMQRSGIFNSGMEVRNRLCNCIAAYEIVRKSPSITPDTHLAFWKLFIASCRELMEYTGVRFPGLIPAAVMFPEFTEAPVWLEVGRECLHHCLVERTTPEGAWDTHSISYQTVPVPWGARSLEFLRANPGGGEFAQMEQMVRTQIGKLLGLMLRIAMPNGALPNIGDTYGRSDWSDGHTRQLLTSFIHSQLSPEQQENLSEILDPYARLQAALLMADGGRPGDVLPRSLAAPGSGYYVLRSGWEPAQAQYLYFDLSPQALGHAHNDATHFELYAYGKSLLTDTGDYFLGWGYRTALHNAVEVDGRQQDRGAAALMFPCDFVSAPGLQLVDGAHGAYESLGVTQRRKMLHLLDSYYVLTDVLTGEGSHLCEQFFHFAGPSQNQAAQVTLDPQTAAAFTTHEKGANVVVAPVMRDDLAAQFVEGQDTEMRPEDKYERSAMLGWMVTTGTFKRVKSPALVYSREGRLPLSFCQVLLPLDAGWKGQVAPRGLTVTGNGGALTPEQATAVEVSLSIDRPRFSEDETAPEQGPNLALDKSGNAEINQGSFGSDAGAMLTDGDLSSRTVGRGASSGPYTPGVLLQGRFWVDFGEPKEVNTLVLHHAIWNGSTLLYPAESMVVEFWDGEAWAPVTGDKTVWGAEMVSSTSFDTVRTSRIGVRVERPSGGRLAMREIEAYCVAPEELRRVEALRAQRTSEQWTDTLLIRHSAEGELSFGGFSTDAEVCLVRTDDVGEIHRIVLKEGTTLTAAGEPLLRCAHPMGVVDARWQGESVDLDCFSPVGVEVRAGSASRLSHRGRETPFVADDGVLRARMAPEGDAPVISDVQVTYHPAQQGLAGGQPWAAVTWQTSTPATTQVQFEQPGVGVRRTICDEALVTAHSAQVEFLRPGEEYQFRPVSLDAWGRPAEQ